MSTVTKHFVLFFSPGTFVSEVTERPVDAWDVEIAKGMAATVKELHDATPYGFQFITRSRGPHDLDSKVTKRSPMHYLGGQVLTLADVKARHDPKDSILIANMEGNKIARVIQNDNSWRVTIPLDDKDVVLEWEAR